MDAIALPRIGETVAALARRGGFVAVVAAGHSGELVATEVRRAIGATLVRVARADVARAGALGDRLQGSPTAVVIDAQWADPESLERLLDEIGPGLGIEATSDRTVVLISRPAAASRQLARLHQLARRADLLVDLAAVSIDDLVAAGVDVERAGALLEATAGQVDLIDAIELDGSLGPEIARRLSVLDDAARRAAELLAFGATLDDIPLVVVEADGRSAEAQDEVLRALIDEGVLLPDRTMSPGVTDAVRQVATPARRAQAIAALREIERPGTLEDLALLLARIDDRSPAAGEAHLELARRHAALDPEATLADVSRARDCGIDDPELTRLEAVASLATGDPERALRLLGTAASSTPDPVAELVRAAAWSALGDLGAAAAALERSELPDLAAWAHLGAGRSIAPSTQTVPAGSDAPASPRSGAVDALLTGLDRWRDGELVGADEHLRLAVRRFAVEPGTERWPVAPSIVAALVAARTGDLPVAARTVNDAVMDRLGGPSHHRAHVLVSAWLAARQGHLDDAAAALASLRDLRLSPQEHVWRAATACAIAVRDAEGDGLARCAADAADAVRSVGAHLYDLDLLVDIAAAAARLLGDGTGSGTGTGTEGDGPMAGDPLAAIEAAVERLGSPPAFRYDVAWARLRAALASDDVERIRGRALDLLALGSAPAHLTATASAARLLVDVGEIDPADVERVARELARIGCSFEAARLCGVIALGHDDEGAARRLLKESRTWRSKRAQLKTSGHVDRSVVRLSEQETKVAELVVDGLTHKQIGSALFISAKTVEHHVAHIRTKLGAGSRAELLAAIRAYLGDASPVGSIPS